MAFPKIDGYVVTEKLGSGSYSTVYKAYNKVGGRQSVAIKCVARSLVRCGAAVDNLVSEIRLLKALQHPHIVRMHDFTWDQKNIYIIMELCNAGDLCAYIRRRGRLPEPQARYFMQQLVSALKYLHENGVSHRDLKPHNLLLQRTQDRYDLKLADFGFAMQGVDAAGGVRGSPLYMAPEGLAGRAGPAADLWSLGVVFYECMFGSAPYASTSLEELLQKVQRQDHITIPAHPPISPECRSLLRSLLQHDPGRRITHEELFDHPYLDLEHMPSDENYQKAVSALHRAASLERAGRAGAALAAYRAGLGLLTPCAARVTDPVRREHFTRRLAEYMDRAEQIKQYLKDTGQQLPDESEYWKEEASEAARRGLVKQDVPVTSVTSLTPASVTSAIVTPATVTPNVVTPAILTHKERPKLHKNDSTVNNKDTREKENNDACRIT